ncbi:MAG: lactate permease LctP family transporter [Burkholderiaceae bacterium]|nr:lactate permease LctP family transporter [Burkholderiaceae bacterium]
MWQHTYDPIGNIYLSALLAVAPVLFFLLALTLLKLKAMTAAALTLVLSIGVAALLFGMPIEKIVAAAIFGVLSGLWPIGYIILMAVWLYKLAVKSGKFEIILCSIASISEDQRVQVILIAFCFGAFLEGAAGFGVPIAICAALLVELGFKPLKAAMLCLIANAASGAYGAIGIPVLVGALQGGVELSAMSLMLILIVQTSTLFVPALLVLVLDGWHGVRETWPVVLGIGFLFTITQSLTLYFLGPELVDIIAPLLSMGALATFMMRWQPSRIYREAGASEGTAQRGPLSAVLMAWSPFYILTIAILVWSLPAFKSFFAPGGWLADTVQQVKIPFLHGQVQELPPVAIAVHALPAEWTVALLNASGTAILISAALTTITSRKLTLTLAWGQLRQAGIGNPPIFNRPDR